MTTPTSKAVVRVLAVWRKPRSGHYAACVAQCRPDRIASHAGREAMLPAGPRADESILEAATDGNHTPARPGM